MRYTAEKEISDVIESFESATISRADWRMLEHMIVAIIIFRKTISTRLTKKCATEFLIF